MADQGDMSPSEYGGSGAAESQEQQLESGFSHQATRFSLGKSSGAGVKATPKGGRGAAKVKKPER